MQYITHLEHATRLHRRAFVLGGTAAVATMGSLAKASSPFTQHSIDRFIINAMHKSKIPGIAVGYAKNGVVQFARGYGFADLEQHRRVTVDTVFPVASITKPVTALALMRLFESGKLKLDDPIAGYLDFPITNPHHPDDPITFRHLLMHTSSISDAKYYEVDTRIYGHDATTLLRDHIAAFLVPGGKYYSADGCYSPEKPGANWDYSNLGFALTGYLVDRIGGSDGSDQITKQVFEPLGMHHTYWKMADIPARLRSMPYDFVEGAPKRVPAMGLPDWPAGAIRSSVADFIKLVAAFANGGSANGIEILGAARISEMLMIEQPTGLPAWMQGQGLGWGASRLGDKVYPEHWGGSTGIFTAAYLDPLKRAGVVIFTNATATPEGKTAVKAIAQYLLTL